MSYCPILLIGKPHLLLIERVHQDGARKSVIHLIKAVALALKSTVNIIWSVLFRLGERKAIDMTFGFPL